MKASDYFSHTVPVPYVLSTNKQIGRHRLRQSLFDSRLFMFITAHPQVTCIAP